MTTPQNPAPQKSRGAVTDSTNSPLVVFDGPGDTTIRPARPDLPRYFPGREPPDGYFRADRPSKNPPPPPEKG